MGALSSEQSKHSKQTEYYTNVEVKNVLIYYMELLTAVKRLSVPALGCNNGLGIPKTTYKLVTFILLLLTSYQESNQNILSKLSILDSILAIKGLSVLALGCTDGLGIPKTTYNLVTFIILVWAPYQESKL
jgi:hypothetical protein